MKFFARQEDAMSGAIGVPSGCNVQTGTSAETDTYAICKIDAGSVARVKAAMPCDKIGDILSRHEDLHRRHCLVRQHDTSIGSYWRYTVNGANDTHIDKYFPPLMQTPAGAARARRSRCLFFTPHPFA